LVTLLSAWNREGGETKRRGAAGREPDLRRREENENQLSCCLLSIFAGHGRRGKEEGRRLLQPPLSTGCQWRCWSRSLPSISRMFWGYFCNFLVWFNVIFVSF
jgi:hypothetical protein